jgi:hypothetical protein
MRKVDMSPAAVTARLVRTSQLRRLSLALRPQPSEPDSAGEREPQDLSASSSAIAAESRPRR